MVPKHQLESIWHCSVFRGFELEVIVDIMLLMLIKIGFMALGLSRLINKGVRTLKGYFKIVSKRGEKLAISGIQVSHYFIAMCKTTPKLNGLKQK